MAKLKYCTKGRHSVSRDEFSRDKRNRDGLSSWCRPCYREYRSTPDQKAKDKVREKRRKEGDREAFRAAQNEANRRYTQTGGRAAWHAKNPRKRLTYYIRDRYNLTLEQYDAIVISQSGRCACCLTPSADLEIDHDHACCPVDRGSCGDCVRGLLCGGCNRMLGMAKDDPDSLVRGAEYLRSFTS